MQPIDTNKMSQQIFFITDLEKIIGRNRLTLRHWWLDGKLPSPIKLNGTTLLDEQTQFIGGSTNLLNESVVTIISAKAKQSTRPLRRSFFIKKTT